MLFKKFKEIIKEKIILYKNNKILIAVSGGLDSMLLLNILYILSKKIKIKIFVAYFDHNIRALSKLEGLYLKKYCKYRKIKFFKGSFFFKNLNNFESIARNIRYNFFFKIMKKEKIKYLFTAHHKNDQIETIFMNLIKYGSLNSICGINEYKKFYNKFIIIRPFLNFYKKELFFIAKKKKINYFNDYTNKLNFCIRNYFRNFIIPKINNKIPNFFINFIKLNKQFYLLKDFINYIMYNIYIKIVKKITNGWKFKLSDFLEQKNIGFQYFFLKYFFENTLLKYYFLNIKFKQIEYIILKLKEKKSQWIIYLNKNWIFIKEYNLIYLKKINDIFINKKYKEKLLNAGNSIFLSKNNWFAVENNKKKVKIPKKIKNWFKYYLFLNITKNKKFLIRNWKFGDKIIFKNYSKKLSRFFIDNKISNTLRYKIWIILINNKIIWIPGFFKYNLSINNEIGKINYKLIFISKYNFLN